MKINRKGMVLGFATLGIAAALATGVGVAQAETGPAPAASTSATAPFGHGGGMGAMMVGQRSGLTAAATYLGLSETDLPGVRPARRVHQRPRPGVFPGAIAATGVGV